MSKRYLLCKLNDEDYAYPTFSQFENFDQAFEVALLSCGYFINGDMHIDIEENRKRIYAHTENNRFIVTEIKEIDASTGDCVLVWHHAYNGVGFNILCIGTYEECEKKRKEEIQKIFSEYDLSKADNEDFDIETDNVVDTGEEWEVFSIIKIGE